MGHDRAASRRDLRSARRVRQRSRRMKLLRGDMDPVAIVLLASRRRSRSSRGGGQTGTSSPTPSASSQWGWVIVAILLNLAVGPRARGRVAQGDRAGDAAASGRASARSSPLSASAFSRTPSCRAASGSSRASPCSRGMSHEAARRRVGDARGDGLRAPRLRPLPDGAADRLRPADGPDPALGADQPRDRGRRRVRALRVRARERSPSEPLRAGRGGRGAPARDDGPLRARGAARAGAGGRSRRCSSASAGSASCSRSGRRCGPSTSTSRCPPPVSCSS